MQTRESSITYHSVRILCLKASTIWMNLGLRRNVLGHYDKHHQYTPHLDVISYHLQDFLSLGSTFSLKMHVMGMNEE